ncbi:hypothetical protein DDZ16_17485 [Marinilabilia rubra]|uniref:Uncharacterized protein n=1 Tax=Marinilabilia rubra TaxID=2162893 RepID=A0A2U2B504_9BACT|nr:hypothetical protein DDZ16_17485 [Marinilabilia rubra]
MSANLTLIFSLPKSVHFPETPNWNLTAEDTVKKGESKRIVTLKSSEIIDRGRPKLQDRFK